MGVTYTAARVRDHHEAAAFARRLDAWHACSSPRQPSVSLPSAWPIWAGSERSPVLAAPAAGANTTGPRGASRGAGAGVERRLHRFTGLPLRGARAGSLPGRAARGFAASGERGVDARDPGAGNGRGPVAAGGVRGAAAGCARGRRPGQEAPAGLDPAADVCRFRRHQAAPFRQDRPRVQVHRALVAGRIPARVLRRAGAVARARAGGRPRAAVGAQPPTALWGSRCC